MSQADAYRNAYLAKPLTRRQKRVLSRKVVLAALLADEMGKHWTWEELLDGIIQKIQAKKLSPFTLDRRDVSLALRWLHAAEKVKVAHRDALTGEPVHRVTVRKT